jgi:single-stranded DNA-binding protein
MATKSNTKLAEMLAEVVIDEQTVEPTNEPAVEPTTPVQTPWGFANLQVLGRISRMGDLEKTVNGHVKLNFGVACNPYRGEKVEPEAVFINCQAWDNQAKAIKAHFPKSRRILASGDLRNWDYVDNEGVNRTYTYLVIKEWHFIDDKPSAKSAIESSPL